MPRGPPCAIRVPSIWRPVSRHLSVPVLLLASVSAIAPRRYMPRATNHERGGDQGGELCERGAGRSRSARTDRVRARATASSARDRRTVLQIWADEVGWLTVAFACGGVPVRGRVQAAYLRAGLRLPCARVHCLDRWCCRDRAADPSRDRTGDPFQCAGIAGDDRGYSTGGSGRL